MKETRTIRWTIAAAITLAGLLLGLIAGGLIGGLIGYFGGRGQETPQPELEARLDQVEQQIGEMQERLDHMARMLEERPYDLPEDWPLWPMPWGEMPPGYPGTMMAGALITQVLPDTPAERAGLQPGDIILAVEEEAITPRRQLADVLAQYHPGDRVTLALFRQNEEITVPVHLEEHPDIPGRGYLGVQAISMGRGPDEP